MILVPETEQRGGAMSVNLLPAAAGFTLAPSCTGFVSHPVDLRFSAQLDNANTDLMSDGRAFRGGKWFRKSASIPIGSEVWWSWTFRARRLQITLFTPGRSTCPYVKIADMS